MVFVRKTLFSKVRKMENANWERFVQELGLGKDAKWLRAEEDRILQRLRVHQRDLDVACLVLVREKLKKLGKSDKFAVVISRL
jgi:hypothetical protein